MDDRVFDLLEKVYIELQETKKEVKDDIKNLSNRIIKIEILIENSIAVKINSLFEAQMVTNEKLAKVEQKIDKISQKVDKHDIRIQVIEGRN